MQRITDKQLENLATWINELTGSPVEYRNKETGKINIGHFTLSHAYGGVCLHRIVNDGGGCSTPIVHGHIPKRELFEQMHAFIKGLEFAKYEAMRKAA
jgi:hypothetical protein